MPAEGSGRRVGTLAFAFGLAFGVLVGIYAVSFLTANWRLAVGSCVRVPIAIIGGDVCGGATVDLSGIAGVMFLAFLSSLILYLAIPFAVLLVFPRLRGGLGLFLLFALAFIVAFVATWFVGGKAVGV